MKDITPIKRETTLCMCLTCKIHWVANIGIHGTPPKCPTCESKKTIIDQIWEIPDGHTIFTCTCGGKYFKMCRDQVKAPYFLCVTCGQRHFN